MAVFGEVLRSGKKRFVSAAAFSLCDETGLQDPLHAVKQLTGELLAEAEVDKPPVPLKMLASFKGAGEIEALEMRGAGRLIPLPNNEFRIEVRASDPPGRQRFSIAHEIGHLLIPSYHQNPTAREDLLTGEFPNDKEEEYFCDIAARDLLLPESLFREQCSKLESSMDGLLQLADTFRASLEAAALRLDQLSCWNCVPVIWELGLKPTQKEHDGQVALVGLEELSKPIEEFRVKFSAGGFRFPAAKHVPMDSSMVSACVSDGKFSGRCVFPTSGPDIECQAQAVLVPYRDEQGNTKQRIVSLIYVL